MNAIPFIIQGKNIVIIVDNQPHTITETHLNYNDLRAAIINEDWDLVPNLVTPIKALKNYVKGHFECDEGVISEGGAVIHNSLTDRIFKMYQEGFSIDPMLAFYKNIKANPSEDSANELYMFLEHNSLPITQDGCFVAYKRVNDNYTDCHTGKIDNSIGQVVQMPRGAVNSDRHETCSTGLHFCSHDYLKFFGGARIVTIKINPADVVSIPTDYNNSKGRCCKYVVIGELTDLAENCDTLCTSSVFNIEDDYIEDYDDENDEIVFQYKQTVRNLSLRQHALIWNHLTGESLKKFSYRSDVDRRIYSDERFDILQIINAALALGLLDR